MRNTTYATRCSVSAGFVRRTVVVCARVVWIPAMTLVLSLLLPRLPAQTVLYWDANGATAGAGGGSPSGTWRSNGAGDENWNTLADGTAATILWIDNAVAVFSAGSDATSDFTVSVSGTQDVDSIQFTEGTVTLDGGRLKLNGNIPSITVASGLTATVNSRLQGANGFVKAGAGTLVLLDSGNNYDGATTVQAGTLQLGPSNNILPNSTDLVIDAGAAVVFSAGGYDQRVAALAGAGSLHLADNELRIDGDGDTTFSGTLTDDGNATLRKQGNGTLTLSGNSTWGGTLDVNAGVVVVASSNALGAASSGNTVANNAALHFTGGVTVVENDLSIRSDGDGTGVLRNLAGDNTLDATVMLDGNSTIRSDAGTLTLAGDILHHSRNLTADGAGNIVLAGTLDGGGNAQLIKDGTGTLTLTGTTANNIGGDISLNDGTLRLGKSPGVDAIGPGSDIHVGDGTGAAGSAVLQLLADHQISNGAGTLTLAADGRFDLNGFSEAIDVLEGAGEIAFGGGTLTLGVNGGDSAFDGLLTGTGTLIKAGAGLLELSTDLVFAGTLELAGGTLRLDEMSLTLGALHVTQDSIIDFEGVSSLHVTSFTVADGVTLTITDWANASDYFFAQNWTGATFDTSGQAPMNRVVFSGFSGDDTRWQSFDRQITPVPEPSTYGAILLALAAGLVAWFRSRASAAS